MTDLNEVFLIGRLVRDPELAYTQGGMAHLNFALAVNRSRKTGDGQYVEEVSYFDAVLWGKPAESMNQYLHKGKQIGIKGCLKQDRWEQDGQNRSKVYVIVDQLQLFGGNESNQNQGYQPRQNFQQSQNHGYFPDGNSEEFPNEIPF